MAASQEELREAVSHLRNISLPPGWRDPLTRLLEFTADVVEGSLLSIDAIEHTRAYDHGVDVGCVEDCGACLILNQVLDLAHTINQTEK